METLFVKPSNRLFSLVVFAFFCSFTVYSQKAKLLAEPFIGPVTNSTAQVWLAYKGTGDFKLYLVHNHSTKGDKTVVLPDSISYLEMNETITVKAYFSGLKENTNYQIVVKLNDYYTGAELKTEPSKTLYDLHFLAGSCGFFGKGFLRPIVPAGKMRIYTAMKAEDANFMLWLGDNFYYWNKDFDNPKNMFKRQMYYRSKAKRMSIFQANQANYSIWDDHDYGPNNAESDYAHKHETLNMFKAFWPNPSYGLPHAPGVFYTFTKSDVQFFMTDGRWYRSSKDSVMLGKAQMQWLKQALLNSKATFKIIATGSQVLNPISTHDCFHTQAHQEKQELIDFITTNEIKGVIFLTGDRHYSSVTIEKREHAYALYDITSSPITSPSIKLAARDELDSSAILEGSLVFERNFGVFSIAGNEHNRVLIYTVKNQRGKELYQLSLHENDLK